MRDTTRIQQQELDNYIQATKIFNQLFKDNQPEYKQMPDFSVSDMRMRVNNHKFNIELKHRNIDIYKYNEQPLKIKKLINLRKDTKEDERLLYMAIIDGGDYYIWDLDHIDWTQCRMDNMRSLKQQYNIGGSSYVEEPYYYIPLNLAIKFGTYSEK